MLNNLLQSFCTVVGAGSLNRAAAVLHLTQPAVTKQMRALEAELGVQLLRRTPAGVTLTPVGKQVYAHARRAVAAADACRRVASEWNSPDRGRLVLAAGLTPTLFSLPPAIAGFRRRHPGLQVEVRTGTSQECLALLLDYEADLAFVTTAPAGRGDIRVLPLFVDPLVLAVGSAHPLAGRPTATLAELNGQPLISFRSGSGLRQYTDQVMENHGIMPRVVMEFDSIEVIKTMVALNLGVALLPWSAVREDAAHSRLAAIPVADWPDAGRTVALVWRKDGFQTGPMRAFRALVQQQLARP